ncbi:MAG: type II toxin-antitoxin system VapC family toxin [Leptospiraceae bacterium]|nr:type II toxin-antitoxin system VapC family toxin [Leptospiraceae bacterium]
MILCDTDILIEYLKGNPDICTELESIGEENLAISIISYAELIRGALNQKEQKNIKVQIISLSIIHTSEEISSEFQKILDNYALSHRISIPDALIAATAITTNMKLYTRNIKDFKFIKGLILYKN